MACPTTSTLATSQPYERHRPELTPLYRIVSTHLPAFLDRTDQAGGLPAFVRDELTAYLDCGIPERGCAHLTCPHCGLVRVLPFSCKGRGFCPSCTGRRMNDLAVHMTDDVLPDDAHLRQWICSFPFSLRAPMGYDPKLCSALVSAFVREVEHSYRLRAKHHLGLRSASQAHFGALSIIQRADSAMRLDPHPHTLAIDGVYVRDHGRLAFHPLPPPTVEDVHQVAHRTAWRTEKILARFGIDPAGHLPQEAADEDPVLSTLLDASAHGIDLFSERFNRPALRLVGTPPPMPTFSTPPLLAEFKGINVHAQTWVHGHDRAGIERLVRYVARPPVSNDRLSITDSGDVQYELKKPFKDGTTAIVLPPLDFLARLASLVPPPYFNLTRYHGVLSANSKHRHEVVRHLVASLPPPGQQLALPLELPEPLEQPWLPRPDPCPPRKTPTAGRHPWAYLLKRTFRVDATTCPRCSQPLRLVEIATTPEAIRRVMTRAGLAPMPPPPPIPKPHDQVALQI